MASANNDDDQDAIDYCFIEASVVTGFEESARGEAKEKFGTDVKAARGKITWKVPVDRVKDVIKLGSIDNARVLIHSVPHFKFTSDQHDSLARLQKLVPEMDWTMGLRVWHKFFEFEYPVAPVPDVIPDLEDLVDVCIQNRIPKTEPKDGAEKKGKRGGRGKKKERKDKKWGKGKDRGKEGKGDNEKEEKNVQVDGEKGDTGDNKLVDSVENCEEDKGTVVDSVQSSSTSEQAEGKDLNVESCAVPNSQNKEQIDNKCDTKKAGDESKIRSPKTVIIKKADPNREDPKIEITVLDHCSNVFPTDVDDHDQREVEPMDVDQSMNRSVLNTSQALTAEHAEESKLGTNDGNRSVTSNDSISEKVSESSCTGVVDVSASEFASSVIEKLSSPNRTQHIDSSALSPNKNSCSTPPSTPVRNVDSLTFSPSSKSDGCDLFPGLSPSNERETDKEIQSIETDISNGGQSVSPPGESSVDPPPAKIMDEHTPALATDTSPKLTLNSPESSSAEAVSDPPKAPESLEESSPVKKERDPTLPTFRVTCNRVGENHSFASGSAAASLGSAVMKYFTWPVDLTNFDIEVIINIDNEEVTVSLGLTKTSLHNRNIVAFGPTTLRATICYNMLRLSRIKNGDFICDPMCGTGALPIESAMNWPNCYHFGGDFHDKAIGNAFKNISTLQQKFQTDNKGTLKIDAVQWDIRHFPLREKCVDVFVSDLPFGLRMGSRTHNRTLYPCLLSEMARTARPHARACLLTEDKSNLIKAIQTMSKYWQRRLVLSVNIGGLNGCVFLLTRTTTTFEHPVAQAPPCAASVQADSSVASNTEESCADQTKSSHGSGSDDKQNESKENFNEKEDASVEIEENNSSVEKRESGEKKNDSVEKAEKNENYSVEKAEGGEKETDSVEKGGDKKENGTVEKGEEGGKEKGDGDKEEIDSVEKGERDEKENAKGEGVESNNGSDKKGVANDERVERQENSTGAEGHVEAPL